MPRAHLVTRQNDAVAGFAITDSQTSAEGPLYANAGEYFYHLDVISVDHF